MFRGIFALLLLSLVILSGCSGNTLGGNPAQQRFYEGTQGVVTQFDRNTPPPMLYYYEGSGPDSNFFNIDVAVRNVGSSFTRGGVYLSGFDPNLITFENIFIDAEGAGACSLDITNIYTGGLGAVFNCQGVTIGSNRQGGVDFRSRDLLGAIDSVFDTHIQEQKLFRGKRIGLDVHTYDDGKYAVELFGDIDFDYAKRGRLFLALFSGLDFDRFNGQEYILAGDTYEFPGGEVDFFTYSGHVHDWPAGIDQIDQNFLLTSCYLYTTYATPIVCIDPYPYDDTIQKVCRPQTTTWGRGHGAPVTISSVFQENTPLKVRFELEIENVGGGQIYDPGYIEYCSPYYPGRVTPDKLDVVYVGDVRIGTASTYEGDPRLTCTPEFAVRLQNGRGRVSCTYDISRLRNLRSAYETPLVVELWYGYSETQQRTTRIKRVI